ncbi:MAG: nucleotide exchange factor GrpE [Holosporales bacterium]|jgi:molecular chaperone GrpE|nr:nucleotide exchange factor GrpE [Holosporales bacterium]
MQDLMSDKGNEDVNPGEGQGANNSDEAVKEPIESDLLSAKIEELEDKLLRSVAELQNLQRRFERERADLMKYSISGFSKDVLTIRDNLKLALENCPDESNVIVDGIKLTITEMDRVLMRYGITLINSMGKEFNPHLHQAIVEIEDENQRPGMVVKVMQDGFMIHDRLLRPALVGVSKKSTSSE